MRFPIDLLAALAMAIACLILLITHRFAGAPNRYRRVMQQGGTFFLDLNLMHAGYWMLQPLVRGCSRHGISATVVTWLSLLPALLAAVAAATGHWGFASWGLLAAALMDVMDGAVARAAGHSSPAGAVLDSVLDRYAEFLFFAGTFVFYRDNLAAQFIVMAALFGSFLVTYSTAKAEALGITPPRGSMKRSDRLALMVVGTGFTPFSQFWFEAPGGRNAWPILVALGLIAVLANYSAIRRFVAIARGATERASTAEAAPVGVNGGSAVAVAVRSAPAAPDELGEPVIEGAPGKPAHRAG